MYKEQTDNSLIKLLSNHQSLTFLAKINLKKELDDRKIIKKSNNAYEELIEQINLEDEHIQNLRYLNNLGFDIDYFGEKSFTITRSSNARLFDIFACLFGIFLSSISFYILVDNGINIYYDLIDINTSIVFFIFFGLILGRFGIITCFKSANRIINYFNFKFSYHQNEIFLRKYIDFKLVTKRGNPSELKLHQLDDKLTLTFQNVNILQLSNNTYINKRTLEALYNKIVDNFRSNGELIAKTSL